MGEISGDCSTVLTTGESRDGLHEPAYHRDEAQDIVHAILAPSSGGSIALRVHLCYCRSSSRIRTRSRDLNLGG